MVQAGWQIVSGAPFEALTALASDGCLLHRAAFPLPPVCNVGGALGLSGGEQLGSQGVSWADACFFASIEPWVSVAVCYSSGEDGAGFLALCPCQVLGYGV